MIADQMTERLATLQPTALQVLDESEDHRGHSGFRDGGESHFRIVMASPAFVGLSRLQRHRLVHATLGDIVPRIHALALELSESPAR
ncbi:MULTISPECIES: BolA family protein [Paracoccus]|uniref:BolA family protein n=1 Tax=Paracoccus TaxID=265 RepID=UPI00086EE457|nr:MULTISPECIES: BolA family protein [Paracoccus]ODT61688.1 MAG: BolA family transcriptional regulator [Paracoccus sp. SCN 68-21]